MHACYRVYARCTAMMKMSDPCRPIRVQLPRQQTSFGQTPRHRTVECRTFSPWTPPRTFPLPGISPSQYAACRTFRPCNNNETAQLLCSYFCHQQLGYIPKRFKTDFMFRLGELSVRGNVHGGMSGLRIPNSLPQSSIRCEYKGEVMEGGGGQNSLSRHTFIACLHILHAVVFVIKFVNRIQIGIRNSS